MDYRKGIAEVMPAGSERRFDLVLLALVAAVVSVCWIEPVSADSLPEKPRYVFQSIGEGTQLASRAVSSLVQDSAGFVWIGTQDGLFRCDGTQVARFDVDQGLPHTWITQILEGPDGAIWVSAGGELARFDGLRFATPDFLAPIQKSQWDPDVHQHVAITSSNALYVATDQGLVAFDIARGQVLRSWTMNDGLPGTRVLAVHADERDRVWLAVDGQVGYLEQSSGVPTFTSLPQDIKGDAAVALLTDYEGRVWVRTRRHLLRRDPGQTEYVVEKGLADSLNIGAPTLDRSGNLLVPSVRGLFLREGERWKIVSAENGLRASAVTHAIEDREGALWLGLFGPGVQRWAGRRSWSAWTVSEGLPNDGVWGSLRDPDGRLWVGTNDGVGVWRPAERAWRILTPDDGLAGNFVWKFVLGPTRHVWSISRRVGLNRYDPGTLEPEIVEIPGEPHAAPMELAAAMNGTLWIGTRERIWRARAPEGELVFDEIELPAELAGCTESISTSEGGVVWVGGRSGLGRYDDGSWMHFDVDDGLLADRLMVVEAISDWEVWIAYEESLGVTRMVLAEDGPRLTHFSVEQGLAGDRVWLVERGPQGRLWIGGADGLSLISQDGTVRLLDMGDGLIWNDISRDSFWVETDDSVLIGTSRGLAHYVPTGDVEPMRAPRVAITSAILGGEQMLGQELPGVDHSRDSLLVQFAGLTFRNPARVQFKYQLVGLDAKPKPTLTQLREVRFATLPSGQYRFEVWCRSASGMWSPEPATFSFVVFPPWWECWWARLGAAVLLIGLVLAILQVRTRRLAADRRRLEVAVAERSAQLAEANAELRELSYTDSLTMVPNRRFFTSVIGADVSSTLRKYDSRNPRAGGPNRDLVFLLIDLDHFKKVNDLFGHRLGDDVLVEAARRLRMTLRGSDLLVRWGGEEFLIVCRGADRADGRAVAQRILDGIGLTPFKVEGGESFHRTCSVGWASLPGYINHPLAVTHEDVLELADKALYLAKRSGRNRAVGVELISKSYERAMDLRWLDKPLDELEDETLTLMRVSGPNVPTEIKPSRSSS